MRVTRSPRSKILGFCRSNSLSLMVAFGLFWFLLSAWIFGGSALFNDANVYPYESPFEKDPKFIIPDDRLEIYNGTRREVLVVMWDSPSPFTWGQGKVVHPPNYGGYVVDKGECPVDCTFTSDRRLLPKADALLFDVCLTGPREYREVPIYFPEKRPHQRWTWFAYEQQYYFPIMADKEYMDRFDSKMTYHYNAFLQISFTCPWGGLDTFLDPPPKKSSDKVVAFFASNCNTGGADKRTEYVQELMKYIKVDSFGYCLHTAEMDAEGASRQRHSHGDKMYSKIKKISEYKFLLAFENNNQVDDYVTEKLTTAYQAGTVPVYWGSPTVDRWTIGDHSLIKTTDFKSPYDLAMYLKSLNDDDEEYEKYFAWKKKGISPQYQRLLHNCAFNAECRFCQKLANTLPDLPERANRRTPPPPDAFALKFNDLGNRYDSSDQFVDIHSHSALDLYDAFTLSAWINVNLIQDGRIIDKASAGNIDGYSLDILISDSAPASGHLRLCTAGTCVMSKRHIRVGIWYHVAAVLDYKNEQVIIFYINGKEDSRFSISKPAERNGFSLRIGRASVGGGSWRPHHASTIFDGIIDDVTIWSRALPRNEIWRYMFERLEGNEEGLAAYYGFNEGSGNVVRDGGPNKIDGAIIGGAVWVSSVGKPLNDPSALER